MAGCCSPGRLGRACRFRPTSPEDFSARPTTLLPCRAEPRREEFYSALQQLIALVQVGPAEIQGYEQRRVRLAPLVNETQRLLSYAAATGKQIEDPVRKDLVETADGRLTRAISRLPGRSVSSKLISSSPERSRR